MTPSSTLAWLRKVLGTEDVTVSDDPVLDASHTNRRVRAATPGGTQRELLLRRYTDASRDADPWYAAQDEAAAVRAIARIALPVPELVAADPTGRVCDVPTLLLTWLPGRPPSRSIDRTTFVRGLAEPLPVIHSTALVPRTYEPYFVSDGRGLDDLRPPSWALDPAVWERAFAVVAQEPPEHEIRFIHRDYHPGNTVWTGDRLTGIIDWTTGCSGPIGIDLAQMRINLAWEFDLELAEAFLDAWGAAAGDLSAYHPYWDILDAVDWLSDPPAEQPVPPGALDRYEAFVARALAELG